MKNSLTCFFLSVLLLHAAESNARITLVKIGVSGLTCSQCTRSVEMSLRKLDFVQDVTMDLAHTEGVLHFKAGAHVDLDKIARAVTDAGFSLRSLYATMIPEKETQLSGNCLKTPEETFVFLNRSPDAAEKEFTVQLIGAPFLLKKEWKSWKPSVKNDCGNNPAKIYYVTR